MEIKEVIDLIGTSSISYFDKGERVYIKINVSTGNVLVSSIDYSKEDLYIVDPRQPPSGFVKFFPMDKLLTIEEWKVWEDDLGRRNKKAIVHHFEEVEMIKK